MAESEKSDVVIESTPRFRKASATVERLDTPHPDEWITGEHYFGAYEDTTQRLRSVTGVRSEDVTVQPLVQLKTGRRRGALERYLRLAAAIGLTAFLVSFFFEAFTQTVGGLLGGGPPAWRAVTIEISSVPESAMVFVGETERGRTPLTLTERCRGRTISVRVEAPGYATWTWNGLCPQEGKLTLTAPLKRRSNE